MYLGIEIGGTKLQLGVGSGLGGALTVLERLDVDRDQGAAGIRTQIADVAPGLIQAHGVRGVGIGFGGPVDVYAGKVIKSFQIDGWDGYPIVDWCTDALNRPVALGNDTDMGGLGESRFGAGQGEKVVFYSNVGSGIGGSLVIDGQLYLGGSGVAGDIGHTRPSLQADTPDQTVESYSSGWGMTMKAQHKLGNPTRDQAAHLDDLRQRCGGDQEQLDGKMLAAAMTAGNPLAQDIFQQGIRTYALALANMITILGPNVVVIGGGVPLIGEELYLNPLRQAIERYVFPPMYGTYEVRPAALGEEVVVHGALAWAAAQK